MIWAKIISAIKKKGQIGRSKRIWAQSQRSIAQVMQAFRLFCTQKKLFLFCTPVFTKHPYQSFILYIYSIKCSFFYNFLLFPHSLSLSLTNSTLTKNTKILNVRATVTVHTHLFNKIFILLQFFIISSLTTPLSHKPNTTQKY